MELFSECFPTLADAIGYTARDVVRVVDWVRTAEPDIVDQGFRRTIYALDAEGFQWTVFFDPARGVYTGAHPSSSNDR